MELEQLMFQTARITTVATPTGGTDAGPKKHMLMHNYKVLMLKIQ